MMPTKEAFEAWAERLIALATSNIYLTLVVIVALHLSVSYFLKSELQSQTSSTETSVAPLKISEVGGPLPRIL